MSNLRFFNWQSEYKNWRKNGPSEDERLKEWITNGIDKDAIEWAEIFGTYLARKDDAKDEKGNDIKKDKEKNKPQNLSPLTSSQLRKFFGAIKSLQNKVLMSNTVKDENTKAAEEEKKQPEKEKDKLLPEFEQELLMLKPKLAYAVARAKTEYAKIYNFYDVVSKCIDFVKTKQHFKNFIGLLEAIVAYHKVEEEK